MTATIGQDGQTSVPLKVGIIGAGIAGLTTAVALLDAGHDVELYERSRFAKEIGAAIHITPNSARILEHYNFDYDAARGSELTEMAYLDGATMQILNLMQFPDNRATYGAPWQFYHRNDLHAGLLKMATEQKTGGHKVADLRLQTQVVDVDSDGTITFADGQIAKKDLVIIANGINCDLVAKVSGDPAVNVPTGLAMIRFLIPMETLNQDPTTKDFFNKGVTRFVSASYGKKTFVAYPCRGGTMANCCVFHPDAIDWAENESSRPATKQDLVEIAADLSTVIKSICDKAEEVSFWRLRTRPDPVKILTKGRLVLTGDAAHPMLPFLGQGGAMAVEDAGTLGVLMARGVEADEVPQRLELFQQLRKNRSCAMQILSNWIIHGLEKVFEEADPYMDGIKLHNRNELNDWCYRANVMLDAEKLVKQTAVTA